MVKGYKKHGKETRGECVHPRYAHKPIKEAKGRKDAKTRLVKKQQTLIHKA